MKLNFFITILCCCFLFSISNQLTAANPDGGKPLQRESTVFVEDSVLQFRINVPYQTFQNLIDNFERSTDAGNYAVAGFCFIPIVEQTPPAAEVNFHTKGFRVVLTLWQNEYVDSIAQPRGVKFFGFNNMEEVQTTRGVVPMERPAGDISDFVADLVLNNITQKIESRDSVVIKSREFDLVFLDFVTFLDLAKSPRFYNDNIRTEEGIVIERFFNTLNLSNSADTFNLINFRSLIFRPFPLPAQMPDYNSEAALAFSYGYNCPPYWRIPTLNSVFNDSLKVGQETVANFIRKSPTGAFATAKKKTEIAERERYRNEKDDNIWNQRWFQILLIILALVGFLTLVLKAPRTQLLKSFGLISQ